MFIDVAMVPDQARQWSNVCIVVDVLRASSTMVTIFDRGASLILPVGSVREARRLAKKHGYLLGGERHGLKQPGFDFGNSPSALSDMDLQNQGVAFTTSNGTAALKGLPQAKVVLVGCLLNATACCQQALALARHHDTHVGIVCAGMRGGFVLDDSVCAGFLVETLSRLAETCLLSDAALAAQKIYTGFETILAAFQESASGKRITEIGQGADLPFCARPDVSQIVPVLSRETYLQLEPLSVTDVILSEERAKNLQGC